jgi:hypothetical protein
MSDALTIAVAAIALAVSIWQAIRQAHAHRLGLLLGEKETVGFEAIRIARRPNAWVREDALRALLLSAIFEGSDRARIQVYRALDVLRDRENCRRQIIGFRRELVAAADRYEGAVDVGSFRKRVAQLDRAVPWIVEPQAANDANEPPEPAPIRVSEVSRAIAVEIADGLRQTAEDSQPALARVTLELEVEAVAPGGDESGTTVWVLSTADDAGHSGRVTHKLKLELTPPRSSAGTG